MSIFGTWIDPIYIVVFALVVIFLLLTAFTVIMVKVLQVSHAQVVVLKEIAVTSAETSKHVSGELPAVSTGVKSPER